MKYSFLLLLALYKISCICKATVSSPPDHFDIEKKSEDNGDKEERLRRSLRHNYQLPISASYHHLALEPYYQKNFPSILSHSSTTQSTIPDPSCIREHQIDFISLPVSNNGEHSASFTEKVPSVAAENYDHPTYSLPVSLDVNFKTENQPLVTHQNQENCFQNDETVPPTLKPNPHDVFPYSEQTYLSVRSVHPEKILNKENPLIRVEPSHSIDLEEKDLFSLQGHRQYIENPDLKMTYEKFHSDAQGQDQYQSNFADYRREIVINNDNKEVHTILKSYKETEMPYCPGELRSEENCGKTSLNIKKANYRYSYSNGSSEQIKDKTILGNNIEGKSCDIQNYLSKEQFDELRTLLQNIARNKGSKERGFTENIKASRSTKSYRSSEGCSCGCKCLKKLCKCLHLAKNVGEFIAEKSRLALRGLGGVINDEKTF